MPWDSIEATVGHIKFVKTWTDLDEYKCEIMISGYSYQVSVGKHSNPLVIINGESVNGNRFYERLRVTWSTFRYYWTEYLRLSSFSMANSLRIPDITL